MTQYRLPTYSMDLPTFVDAKKKELAIDLKVAKLGVIDSYDETTGTATVEIKAKFNEKTPREYMYPKIPDVPVLKTKYFSHPIKPGDGCLIIFLDTDFTAWLDRGLTLSPASPRLHNLNDAIAIVGIDTISERPTFGNDNTNTIINAGEGKINIQNEMTTLSDIWNLIYEALSLINTASGGSATGQLAQLLTKLKLLFPRINEPEPPSP